MFKNAFLYRLPEGVYIEDGIPLEDRLSADAFAPCAPTQEKSIGWVPPRGHDHGAFLESVGGHWILKLMTETRKVPAQAIKERVAAQCKVIEDQTGRKPGKKEKRELQEDAKLALLPQAFSSKTSTLIWFDLSARILLVDASTQTRADDAITMLIRSIDGLALQLINTKTSPASAMAHWLASKESPAGFSIDRECILKACDESKAVVKYGRHPLDIDEVAAHIATGKLPTRLALTFDGRVSFVLTDFFQIKKISILDIAFEAMNPEVGDDFDANIAIATGEISRLITALIDELGGAA